MRVAFIGGGNMAGALVGGMLAKGFAAADISVVEIVSAARLKLASAFAIGASAGVDDATRAADAIVLAVKPQDMRAALAPVAPLVAGKLVISIAAGLRLGDISRWLGGHRRVVRTMPNMPALIGAGITGLYAPAEVGAEDRDLAGRILGAVGETVWVGNEDLLDPVTAVSGSGPAYVFWFIEQLAASGERLGLDRTAAVKLARATVLGAAKLAAQSEEPAGVLRERVTSKGGTTEAALKVFAEENMAERLDRALRAASARGAELGISLGKD